MNFSPISNNDEIEQPLVTFALFAYNQENYIKEAIDGAFSQTYEPMEIILSDDCSTDHTFEIMRKMASEYRGRHTIHLIKNNMNLGIIRHVKNVYDRSNGSIIVNASGDDISYPNRVRRIVQAFQESDCSLVSSNIFRIDSKGVKLPSPQEHTLGVLGCTLALRKDLITTFPAFIEGMHTEDVLLIQRAEMLNGISIINDPLLDYRIHDSNASLGLNIETLDSKQRMLRNLKGIKTNTSLALLAIVDAAFKNNIIEESVVESKLSIIGTNMIKRDILSESLFTSSAAVILGLSKQHKLDFIKLYLNRWLPLSSSIYRKSKKLITRGRHFTPAAQSETRRS